MGCISLKSRLQYRRNSKKEGTMVWYVLLFYNLTRSTAGMLPNEVFPHVGRKMSDASD